MTTARRSRMGYADLAEVFDGVRDPAEVLWYDVFHRYGWPVTLTLDAVTGGRLLAHTHTDAPRLVGGVASLERRADVPCTSLRPAPTPRREGITGALVDTAGHPVVPCLFCGDEQAELGPDCMLYDADAGPYETLQSIIDTY
jgi:hypothetical protein